MKNKAMGKRGYACKRDDNEPGIVAALELAGASVVPLDKPLDLLVGYAGDTDLLEVKNGNQPPSWQRVTNDQAAFFSAWKGKRATVVTTMLEALHAIKVPTRECNRIMLELADQFDEAGVPHGKKRAK